MLKTTSGKASLGSVLILGVALAFCCIAQDEAKASATKVDVKVAANLPLTGFLGVYGKAIQDGAVMAIQDLQKTDPNGPKIGVDWQDNAAEPKTAVSIMQKQLMSKPMIYVSGLKPQAMAIMGEITRAGLPHFVWILDAFINKESTNNTRTLPNYKLEAEMYLKYAKVHASKKIAIMYVQLPHSIEEFNRLVIPRLKEIGASAMLVEPYDPGRKDFKDLALKVANFKPDLIILCGFQPELVGMIRALRPHGLMKGGNTIATFDMLEASDVLGNDEKEGIRVVAPRFVVSKNDRTVEWRKRFRALVKRDASWMDAYGYDMIQVIEDAAKRVKDPSSGKDWIEAIRATKMEGVTGPLKFDSDGSLVTPLVIATYRDGKLVEDAQTTDSTSAK